MAGFGVIGLNAAEAYLCSLGRSASVALLAVGAAFLMRGLLAATRSTWQRRCLWALYLAPLLTPALLVGYVYRSYSLALVHHRWANEGLYVLLAMARLAPVATAILCFAPPPAVSPPAMWCARLADRMSWRMWLGGPATNFIAAAAVVFLLAFAEFEIAALMEICSWPLWLFNRQALSPPLSHSLADAIVPVLCQLAVVTWLGVLLFRRRGVPAPAQAASTPGAALRIAAVGCIGASLLLATLLPVSVVLRQAAGGIGSLMVNLAFGKEILASVIIALAAASVAAVIAGGVLSRARQRTIKPIGVIALLAISVPGLLGSLLVSLLVLGAFQWPLLVAWRDGPMPLVLALVIVLLPLALVLGTLLIGLSDSAAVHTARQLKRSTIAPLRRTAGRLLWQLKDRAAFYVFFLMFLWAYFDLCAAVILQPREMVFAPQRLYNLMHYGQFPVHAAMLAAYVAAPLLLLIVVAAGRGVSVRLAAGLAPRGRNGNTITAGKPVR